MNIVEALKKAGVELTEEVEKKFGGEWITTAESEKKIKKVETERDALKDRAESAEETLKGFDGKDFEAIQKDRDAWKKKFEDAEKDYQKKVADAEREKLIDEHIASIQFSNEYAKRAYRADILEAGLTVNKGVLLGAGDFKNAYSKDAFVDVEAKVKQEQAQATRSNIVGASVNNHTNAMTKEDIRKIKDPIERQQKIAENIHLYQ